MASFMVTKLLKKCGFDYAPNEMHRFEKQMPDGYCDIVVYHATEDLYSYYGGLNGVDSKEYISDIKLLSLLASHHCD